MTNIHSQLTVEQWLDFLCINRNAFARKLGVTRQTVANWAKADKINPKYREAIQDQWRAHIAPDQLFEDSE